jgi:hypothetical protein
VGEGEVAGPGGAAAFLAEAHPLVLAVAAAATSLPELAVLDALRQAFPEDLLRHHAGEVVRLCLGLMNVFEADGTVKDVVKAGSRQLWYCGSTTFSDEAKRQVELPLRIGALVNTFKRKDVGGLARAFSEAGFPALAAAQLAVCAHGKNTNRPALDQAVKMGVDPTDAFQLYLAPPRQDGWDERWSGRRIDHFVDLGEGGQRTFDFSAFGFGGRLIRLPEAWVTNWKLTLTAGAFDLSGTRTLTGQEFTLSNIDQDITLGGDVFMAQALNLRASPDAIRDGRVPVVTVRGVVVAGAVELHGVTLRQG